MARSKEFDVNEVLDKAMDIFWEQGYEKTSMSDLVEKMGIHRRSIYDTFDDKHSLFLQAMNRYCDKVEVALTKKIKLSKTAREAIEIVFHFMIFEEEESPSGCLIVNSAAELAARDADVDRVSIETFVTTEQLFQKIILWGQQDGEFSNVLDAQELAEYLNALSIGIRVMAKTSTTKEKLSHIVNVSIKLLEG